MNNIEKMVKIARLVLKLKDDGVCTELLISSLVSAIDLLIEIDHLDFKETWDRIYTAILIAHDELS